MFTTRSYALRLVVLTVLLGSLFAGTRQASRAQSDEVKAEDLFSIELKAAALPPAPAFIRLVRISLDPGAVSPEHTHPGPEFGRVESGVVTVTVNGPASIKQRSAKANDPFETAEVDSAIQLDRGDQIYYPTGTALTFRNDGEEVAEVLAVVILPGAASHPPLIDYTGDDPGEEAFNGVTSEILGDGIMTAVPTDTSVVSIQRVKLTEGQSLPGSRNPILYSVESGNCELTVTGGSVQISRKREPGPQTDVAYDEELKLRSGDGMFFPNGLRTTSRGENSADLTLLSVTVSPLSADEKLSEVSRGQIRFKQPDAKAADQSEPTANDSGDKWAEGDTVYVNSSDVNMRDSASLDGGLVTVLLYGQAMIVDGGPTEADGVIWWPVHIADDESLAGFVSEEFLQTEPAE